ncbi:oxidoreductase [Kovacikia minuta CCNUW1]|uniref:oxidoreductase n=1 Tax=Kovacikia minuta TaxID=2931930 RepID=UPI001CCDB652|nr:oxidoreductase [Kovacikia minuta]UBF27922.1 oxidoreductase [Kovacikia minuta CCNUW1]
MADQVRVGLIGYGVAGRVFHAPIIQAVPGLKLTQVVERHSETARDRYPWVTVVKDAASLFNDSEIDLVVIATPNPSHFDLAKQALSAGKHVVIDKPFTTTSEQAQQLIDLANRQNRILSVHQNRRWDGDFQTLELLLEAGYLGQLVEYESHYDRFRNVIKPGAWRETAALGSGILFDLGSHLIDQAQVLFGLPESITADIQIQREGGKAADYFEVVLHYRKLKAILKAGMLVRGQIPHFILHGTEGSFVKYGMDPQEDALRQGRSPLEPDWGLEPQTQWGTLNTQMNGSLFDGKIETRRGRYQAYYENVYAAIAQGAPLAVKPEEARNTIRIIELALQSHAEQRTVAYSS